MRSLPLLVVLLALAAPCGALAQEQRAWEVNGIRLEPSQVERLAAEIARQTVRSVERLEGLSLRDGQAEALAGIYRDVALDVYDEAVRVVAEDDLADAQKEERIVNLVLAGQERSTLRVAEVLDVEQYGRYRAWEERQVKAFRERGLWSGSSRRRGRR